MCASFLAGQNPQATDLEFHKFRPQVAPEPAASGIASQATPAAGSGLTAAQQVRALQVDKALRTPAQRKIDSNILYTVRMLARQPAAPGIPYLDTGVELDRNDNIVVDIVARVTGPLLHQLRVAGAQVLYSNRELRSIRAIIPPSQIEWIASFPEVIFISPRQGAATHGVSPPLHLGKFLFRYNLVPGFERRAANVRRQLAMLTSSTAGTPITWQGSVGTEGDTTHQATSARGSFGINGTGLKIGVLSDGVTSRAPSQATGDLPPDCGAAPCLTVLSGQEGTGDEGTAMLEIIHDMAPGASLYFATAFTSISSFAANIRALRAAGCQIIVDDVFYFVESPFQDGQTAEVISTSNGGVVTQAVNDVVADGALYFSSAGNEGSLDMNTSGTYEGDFVPQAAASPLPTGNVHNFGSGNGYDTIAAAGIQIVGLFWADPLGGSSNDYDLYLLNSTGTSIVAASTNLQTGTQDPVELIGSTYVVSDNRLVVFQNPGAANRFFHLVLFRGQLAVATAGETHGHNAASGAYTVAATPAAEAYGTPTPGGPYPGPFTAENEIEFFSSDGLRRILFNADSTAITPGDYSSSGGSVLNKPDITAADGVSVTGVGGFGSPFYGTSAAAPAAASVAALVLSAKPDLTPTEIRTTLTSTAVDIMAAGFDRDSGNGIVMALPAVQSLGVEGNANPELGTIAADEHPGNGNHVIEAGEGASLTIQLKNTGGVKAATHVTATLTSATAGVIVTRPGTSAYADMAAGAAGGNNMSHFSFTLAADYPCGQTATFTLTVNYAGGSRALNFSLPTGMLSITNTLGSKPAESLGVDTATSTQVNRIYRDGVVNSCGSPKSFPGTMSGSHTFDSYTFTACRAFCMQPELNTGASGANLFAVAYSPSYDPNSIGRNYAGDAGVSTTIQSFGIMTTAGTPYTIVVNDVYGNSPPNSYTIKIPVCALNCDVNQLPAASARDVSVIAGNVGGTANASIDNGSSDPEGDAITVTQTPPGPYPVGASSVLLTVEDANGAINQAEATVTVLNPGFGLAAESATVTASAGGPVTQHVIFTPNPGIASPLSLACVNLPPQSACAFTPPTVMAGSGQTEITVTISTTAATARLPHTRAYYAAWLPFTGIGFLGLTLFTVPGKRRKTLAIALALLCLGALALLVGCGGGTPAPYDSTPPIATGGTPAGTYTVAVTGTSGNLSRGTTFTLTVN